MIEIKGDLWSFYKKGFYKVCITTNGFVKNNGEAVMGRGCALEAAQRFPELPRQLGHFIKEKGNHVGIFWDLITFPVKHVWWSDGDLKLIEQSASELSIYAKNNTSILILPRPGCGNGHLNWKSVREVIESILPDNVLVISKVQET